MIDIIGPIALITMIGYFLGKSSVALETRTLSNVVILVATPALIFHSLTSVAVTRETIGMMSGAALLCVSISGVLGLLVLLASGGAVRSFLPPLMFPNSGNMGLPLIALSFGPQGMQLGVAYFFVLALVQNTVGLSIYSGSVRLGSIVRQPLIYAVLAVLIVTWTGIKVPQIVLVTTQILGGAMVPSMLLLLGASLATLRVADLGRAVWVATGRLAIGLVSALAVIMLLDLDGVAAGVVFVMATMPTAIISYVFAERYQRDAKQVAGSVVVSTLLTFLCLPALIWGGLALAQDADIVRPDTQAALSSVGSETQDTAQ
jgi:predicted permease